MKVTLLQTNIKWSDPSANQKVAELLITEAEGSDLYVLPEMWSTGFATKPKGVAEVAKDMEGVTSSYSWMLNMAKKYDAAMAGSVALQLPDGSFRNRFFFATPEKMTYYDKHHLFTYGNENEYYTAGKERIVTEWRGMRFLLQICYDLRFPVFSRNRKDYDVAIYVANWPDTRQQVWDTLLRARAIENQCYVIGVNRVGDDEQCHYAGGSTVVNAYGRNIAYAEGEIQQTISADLDFQRLNKFREKFPVLADSDEFQL